MEKRKIYALVVTWKDNLWSQEVECTLHNSYYKAQLHELKDLMTTLGFTSPQKMLEAIWEFEDPSYTEEESEKNLPPPAWLKELAETTGDILEYPDWEHILYAYYNEDPCGDAIREMMENNNIYPLEAHRTYSITQCEIPYLTEEDD